MREAVATLHKWLDGHKEKWVEDGPPRRLGYRCPMTPAAQRLWEAPDCCGPNTAASRAAVRAEGSADRRRNRMLRSAGRNVVIAKTLRRVHPPISDGAGKAELQLSSSRSDGKSSFQPESS